MQTDAHLASSLPPTQRSAGSSKSAHSPGDPPNSHSSIGAPLRVGTCANSSPQPEPRPPRAATPCRQNQSQTHPINPPRQTQSTAPGHWGPTHNPTPYPRPQRSPPQCQIPAHSSARPIGSDSGSGSGSHPPRAQIATLSGFGPAPAPNPTHHSPQARSSPSSTPATNRPKLSSYLHQIQALSVLQSHRPQPT